MKSSSSSALMIPIRPIPPDLPVGYRFDPTDEELLGYYLVLLLRGLYSHDMPIGFVNFWELEPGELPGRSRIKSDEVWYFFCERVVHMNKKKRMFQRKTRGGYWTPTGTPAIIENLGKRSTLRFYKDPPKVEKKDSPKGEMTEWIAYEYEIKQTSTLHNPGEFVIIKLMNSLGEKRTKMKTNMSKQKSKKVSASVYDQNQSSQATCGCQNHEVTTVASSASHDVVLSDFDTSESSSQATCDCQNQSSITEVQVPMSCIPENHEENELFNCLLPSDFENQKLPSEIEDSSPKTTACTENQVTQDKTNPSCSMTSKLEDHFDLSFLEDDDFLSKLIDFDVDSKANETFPGVDSEVLAGKDAFREPKRSRLNPGEQQVGYAEQCQCM